MLCGAGILNRRAAKSHSIADQVVIRDAEALAHARQQVVDGNLGQTVPDSPDAVAWANSSKYERAIRQSGSGDASLFGAEAISRCGAPRNMTSNLLFSHIEMKSA